MYYVMIKASEIGNGVDFRVFRTKDENVALFFFRDTVLSVLNNSMVNDMYDVNEFALLNDNENSLITKYFKMKSVDETDEWILLYNSPHGGIDGPWSDEDPDGQGYNYVTILTRHCVVKGFDYKIIPRFIFTTNARSAAFWANNSAGRGYMQIRDQIPHEFVGSDPKIKGYWYNDNNTDADLPRRIIKVYGQEAAVVQTTRIEEMHGKCFSVIDHKIIEEDSK